MIELNFSRFVNTCVLKKSCIFMLVMLVTSFFNFHGTGLNSLISSQFKGLVSLLSWPLLGKEKKHFKTVITDYINLPLLMKLSAAEPMSVVWIFWCPGFVTFPIIGVTTTFDHQACALPLLWSNCCHNLALSITVAYGLKKPSNWVSYALKATIF